MREVKLIKMHITEWNDDYYGASNSSAVAQGISDWEEVTDEDFEGLLNFIHQHNNMLRYKGGEQFIYVLVTPEEVEVLKGPIQKMIAKNKAELKKVQDEINERKKKTVEAKKKREEAKKKREEAKKLKSELEEKKLLEELKKKYEAV